jgi:hypothetical protein
MKWPRLKKHIFNLRVESSLTVGEFKARVSQASGVPPEKIKILGLKYSSFYHDVNLRGTLYHNDRNEVTYRKQNSFLTHCEGFL